MLIAHDLGTSGNKASLHDDSGYLRATVTVDYPTHYAAGTQSEQDPRDWWRAVVTATRKLLGDSGTSAERVDGICVSGQMMGLVLLDKALEPVRPAMIWSDQRSWAEAAALAACVGDDRSYEITGHRLAPTYPLPKLMWVRENDPESYERAAAVCMPKDFVNARLTGRLVTDHSDASSTDAYDLTAGRWSDELLAASGTDAALWPEIVDSTTVIGSLTPPAAAELGLRPTTKVVAGGGDGLMAAIGAAQVTPEANGYVCLGTSAWYSYTAAAPVLDPGRRSFTFRHVIPGLFAPCATSQTGAGSLQWAAAAVGEPEGIDELIAAASDVPAASEGLFFLPYLMGERSPWWDANASGAFLGLKMHHGRAHLTKAVLEGVGYSLALCMAPLRPHGTSAPIDVIGGGAASDTWLKLLADIWQAPVRRRNVTTQANSLGAAVTCLVGLDRADFSVAETLSTVEAEFEPGPGGHAGHIERFAGAYRALQPWFAASNGGWPT